MIQCELVLCNMCIQTFLSDKGFDALGMRTDKLSNFSVHHEKVVNHSSVIRTVNKAQRTDCFALVILKVIHQVESVLIIFGSELLTADAALDLRRFRAADWLLINA